MIQIGSQVKIIKPDHPLSERVGRVVSVNPVYDEYRVVVYVDVDMFSDVFTEDEIEVVKRTGYF